MPVNNIRGAKNHIRSLGVTNFLAVTAPRHSFRREVPMRAQRKFLSRRDILVVAVILAAAAALYLPSRALADKKDAVRAEILYDAKIVRTVPLTPGVHETFAVPGQPNVTLEVGSGKIRFLASTCRDKICVHSGWLSRPGETAACLPNRVAVRLAGAGGQKADTYIN